MSAILREPRSFTCAMAALVGVVVCFEAHRYFEARAGAISDPRYLVARRPLRQGQSLHFLDFATVSHEGNVPKGALTDQDLLSVQGASLRRDLETGEILTAEALQSSFLPRPLGETVPKGMRAYSLEPANALEVRVGDRLDILLQPENPAEMPFTLVEGAQALSERRGDATQGLVVALAAEEIPLVEKAGQRGKLTIALRNPGEALPVPGTHRRRRLWRSPRRKPAIEIYAEGE